MAEKLGLGFGDVDKMLNNDNLLGEQLDEYSFNDSRTDNNFLLFIENRYYHSEVVRCGSASLSYVEGYTNDNKKEKIVYSESELNTRISNIAGGTTYGDWAGITGPGKQLREIIKGM